MLHFPKNFYARTIGIYVKFYTTSTGCNHDNDMCDLQNGEKIGNENFGNSKFRGFFPIPRALRAWKFLVPQESPFNSASIKANLSIIWVCALCEKCAWIASAQSWGTRFYPRTPTRVALLRSSTRRTSKYSICALLANPVPVPVPTISHPHSSLAKFLTIAQITVDIF